MIIFFFSNKINCQNHELDADEELKSALKDYENFTIDSLMNKQYKFIKGFDIYIPRNKSKAIEREIDFNWNESIYFSEYNIKMKNIEILKNTYYTFIRNII